MEIMYFFLIFRKMMKICPGDENVSSFETVSKTSFHSIWSFVDSVYFSDYIIKALVAKLFSLYVKFYLM